MSLINSELMELIEDVKIINFEKEQRRLTKAYEVLDSDYKKIEQVNGSIIPGAKVEIYWKHLDYVDKGYIFTLPGDDDEDVFVDGIVHIPYPQGLEKCMNEPEWIYIDRLISNPEVVKVRIIGEKYK